MCDNRNHEIKIELKFEIELKNGSKSHECPVYIASITLGNDIMKK